MTGSLARQRSKPRPHFGKFDRSVDSAGPIWSCSAPVDGMNCPFSGRVA